MMRAARNSACAERSLTDDELVALAKEGGQDAYVELCHRYDKLAFLVIHRIVKNREDAEDVLQDSLLKAYVHLDSFDGRAKFSTWLTRISINSALMELRKRAARPTQSLEDLTEIHSDRLRELRCMAPDPEAQSVDRQMSLRLRKAVNQLPLVLRGVTLLRQSGDLSVSEIAAMAGITVSATKSRLLRARTELSSRMAGSAPRGIARANCIAKH